MTDWPTLGKLAFLFFIVGGVGTLAIRIALAPTGIVVNRFSPATQLAVALAMYRVAMLALASYVGIAVLELAWYAAVPCAFVMAMLTGATARHEADDDY